MDRRWEVQQYLISIPMGIDKFDGSLIMGKIVVSGAMVPMLHEIIRRNSTEAQRRFVEVPYSEDGPSRSEKLSGYVLESLKRYAADEALRANESIVSMSPVRWHIIGPMAMGIARMEYTTVPLTEWKD